MRGNKQKGMVRRSPAGPIYGYAEVEAALAKVYDAEDAQRTAFRGRLSRRHACSALHQGFDRGRLFERRWELLSDLSVVFKNSN